MANYRLSLDADGVKYHGTVDQNEENPGQFIYGLDENGNKRIIRTDEQGNVLTRVTGSNVEEIDVPFSTLGPNQYQEIELSPEQTMQVIIINEFRAEVDSTQSNEGWAKLQFFLGERKIYGRNRLIDIHAGKSRFFGVYPGYSPWSPVVKIPYFGMIDGEYTQDWYRFLRTLYFSEQSPLIIRLSNDTNETLVVRDSLKLIVKEV